MTTNTNPNLSTTDLRRGDKVVTVNGAPDRGEVVRAEYLAHPAFGNTPARRERWLHVRFEDGARLLVHPSALTLA